MRHWVQPNLYTNVFKATAAAVASAFDCDDGTQPETQSAAHREVHEVFEELRHWLLRHLGHLGPYEMTVRPQFAS